MGLEGTLQVFSLSDIFQVLGLQRKSGVLTVEGPDDTITVSFLGGQVVSADSKNHRFENHLGKLLVRSGRITEGQLGRALEQQKETQQRLGFLLIRERLVSPEDLKEALRLQIFRTVHRAFLWGEGSFRFSQEAQIDYDADHMAPVPTESVLMEAAQMHDELPRLLEKIRSRDLVFRRAAGVENLRLTSSPEAAPEEGTLAVSKAEEETWKWIDGRRTVAQILERVFLSEFEALKGFSELIDRSLIAQGPAPEPEPPALAPPPAARAAPRTSRRALFLWGAVALLVLLAVWLTPRNPWNVLFHPLGADSPFRVLLKSVSLERLSEIDQAVHVYYDSLGRYPRSLEDLIAAGILPEGLLRDPYGRSYRYILRPEQGKFGLYGRNVSGRIDLDLSFDRTLAPVAERRPGRSRPNKNPPEVTPSVQVIE